jgi:thioredoxin reductase/ferredoxin
MAVFTMVSARKRHAGIVAPAQVVGPAILVHDINDDRCTGCDACVAVCPTNVLDLVANKSRVLRFHDCIQCEACMIACPTEALVMFPEGTTPPPLKVPEIDDNFQTIVPGQYLIGEVAGKPLVKSAANLGRAVVEHMLMTGMQPGAIGRSESIVDVAIVGSGPGGLSAALTCIQRGLSYVVLEKEQILASTIARYPKGKLVMAEPYDTMNLSFLPVFDSAKEQLIPIWDELIQRVQLRIHQGESVETVARAPDGAFEIRTTVNTYRAQRVVLSIGTRGKPRTLQVPGENLPKIYNLLEDPDDWRGRSVLVVGGGDSACEAALALADSGAKVMISYRGKGFNRAAPRNKQAIEQYASEGRIKAKLGSQVLQFEGDSVTLALADGTQKRYPNEAAFVLIGADPPIQWLEKMGIRFIERPHQYQMGKTDDIVRRFVQRAMECPEDAARAAAQILGGSMGVEPAMPKVAAAIGLPPPMPMGEPVSGPRKWLRSATSIFSNRTGTNVGPAPTAPTNARFGEKPAPKTEGKGKKLDAPMPLSEFAKRNKTQGPSAVSSTGGHTGIHHQHTGHGRRDQLSAGERTRILRMLRDEGGRLADEDSQVYIGAAPGQKDYDFDFDDGPAAPPPAARPDVPAKPAVVVGIAQANSRRDGREAKKKPGPPPPPQITAKQGRPPRPPTKAPPVPRRAVPPPFSDEPTRQVDDEILTALRSGQVASGQVSSRPTPSPMFNDEPTRLAGAASEMLAMDDMARAKFPDHVPATDPQLPGSLDYGQDEATSISSFEGMAAMERARAQGPTSNDERTRAVNIRNDPSISDIDWDLD